MTAAAFLAALDTSSLQAAGGGWWRTVGGLAVVFGLLFLSLKLLGRYGRRQGGAEPARLVTVWHLGARREIQVLRLGADVSYVYRHENAMVLLRQEPWEAYVREHGTPATGPGAAAVPEFLSRLLKASPLGNAGANE